MNLRPAPVLDLAKSLKAELAGHTAVPDLRLLPFKNKDGPPSPHTWWLAHVRPKIPTFGFAKFVVCDRRVPNHLFCGLQLERGYDSPLASAAERYASTWAWEGVLRQLSVVPAPVLSRAEKVAGEPLWICVDAPPEGIGPVDRVDFTLSAGKLHLQPGTAPTGPLRGLEKAATLPDLLHCLQSRAAGATFAHWTNLFAGLACTADPAGPDERGRCANTLACFADLLL